MLETLCLNGLVSIFLQVMLINTTRVNVKEKFRMKISDFNIVNSEREF